jgi:hypothetical protein
MVGTSSAKDAFLPSTSRVSRFLLSRPCNSRALNRTCRSVCFALYSLCRREQTPAGTAVSLDVGVGVILTARAPNRRRSSRAFGGRDDAAPRWPHTGENNGHDHIARHRPRSANARRRWILLQSQGLSWKDGSLAGSFTALRQVHRSHGLTPALTCGGVWTQSRKCATGIARLVGAYTIDSFVHGEPRQRIRRRVSSRMLRARTASSLLF